MLIGRNGDQAAIGAETDIADLTINYACQQGLMQARIPDREETARRANHQHLAIWAESERGDYAAGHGISSQLIMAGGAKDLGICAGRCQTDRQKLTIGAVGDCPDRSAQVD